MLQQLTSTGERERSIISNDPGINGAQGFSVASSILTVNSFFFKY